MPIIYKKLFELMAERGVSTYRLRKDNVIGSATLDKLKSGVGNIDTRSIARLCEYLDCQPGDLMEYQQDERVLNHAD